MKLADFDYYLPACLIAQEPLPHREQSRLLVLKRASGEIEHRRFTDILEYIKEGDVLAANNTRVIPARLFGVKEETGARVEVLLLKRLDQKRWEALVRPGKRVKLGAVIYFGAGEVSARVVEMKGPGERVLDFSFEGVFEEWLDRLGQVPLPPYIHEKLANPERYQTVYARHPGSAAAPTAGLHFTPGLIEKLKEKGAEWVEILLHVGTGTFRPVKAEDITRHRMHREDYEISREAAGSVNRALREGRRVIAVGTTSTRALESAFSHGEIRPGFNSTDIFIYPGYEFKVISGLITNFHLPRSTLLMLVCALAGRENIFRAYDQAVREQYRFFSFGDAMLII
ncbi:MAG: tRNA preQ1(34) S-adenosylmethionine ribosyltransferase-isomerase QueA [Peptococcaceae bacterium]|jgi:S-adenosylmethionine:tRNA ribosyltransferase-isomerase|nr:tRNA preQ1(34) S-adenosylmethionine ribosyltransferase-isomerase QueA [Peptococcaceae bacterium]MDH7525122.1 tRNA preQ1(34) S-adenosylmethionine ribosyltransferase-isomerase QueA [Peptococcaceae bacterium]